VTTLNKISDHELNWLRQVHTIGAVTPQGETAQMAQVLRERGLVRSTGAPGQEIYVLSGPGVLAVAPAFSH